MKTANIFLVAIICIAAILGPNIVLAVDYDIVYVRAPRNGDTQLMAIPEVFDPIKLEAGTDLVLLHPDGSEEILINCDTQEDNNGNEKCAILDPSISFDGRWVYYSKVADQTNLNSQRRDAAYSGADIFKMNLRTRQITQLTFQEWTPNTGARAWSSNPLAAEPGKPNHIRYGIYNLGPSPLPGGRVVFSSSRNGYQPNKGFTSPNLQLFVMDDDGKNVELIGHMNLGSAMHPSVLRDGRIMFSSYEAQGLRDERLWGLWYINPDGSNWGPLMSAFDAPLALHWQTQMSDGNILITEYYNLNNSGFGTFYKFPDRIPNGQIPFGSPYPGENPALQTGTFSNGLPRYRQIPFSPFGLETVTPFTHPNDNPSALGKVTQPSGAPNNELLLVYSPGPANHVNGGGFPRYDAGLYLLGAGVSASSPTDFQLIKNDPAWNEQQPRAVVPYQSIYGIPEPANLAPIKNDGSTHANLPAGSPYGLVGTSTFYRRDTTSGRGDIGFGDLDAFNSFGNDFQVSTNWFSQGADAGRYDNSDIYAVRVLAMEPTSAQAYGPGGFQPDWQSHANERLRILGEIPLRKYTDGGAPILDSDDNPDTSFMAKLPADIPFTFQTIDVRGFVLNMSQTWHQLRPGEVRDNCGGCHGHSQEALPFAGTQASKPDYVIPDLANSTPMLSIDQSGETTIETVNQGAVDVEFYRDIKPILERSCAGCHSASNPQGAPAQLELDIDQTINGYDNAWHRLANDRNADYGIPPLTAPFGWRMSNMSRYIRGFQARRSLLMWKLMGERLDGWNNSDHPSPRVRGDKTTLPNGGSNSEVNRADIDFDGNICPPPGTAPALSNNEKMLFARWIDLGAPISIPNTTGLSWFTDELRPTLTLSEPALATAETLSAIQIGMHDFNSGLNPGSLSVKANFAIAGRPANRELASLFNYIGNQVWRLNLAASVAIPKNANLTIQVKDNAGNLVTVKRSFKNGVGGNTEAPQSEGFAFPIKSKNGNVIMIML